MIRIAAIAGAAMLAFALPAAADQYYNANDTYNSSPPPSRNTACERQRTDDKVTGGVVGAVVGGLIGGAIGNNIDDDDHRYRGHRGYRGHYGNRGYRGRRGYRHGGYHHKNDNDEEVIVGALLGAVVGGIAGSSLAESSARDCREVYRPRSNSYGTSSGYPHTPPPTQPVSTRRYPAPAPAPAPTTYPRPVVTGPECRTVYRETQMPNGEVVREPVQACRTGANGDWQIDGDGLAGGAYSY